MNILQMNKQPTCADKLIEMTIAETSLVPYAQRWGFRNAISGGIENKYPDLKPTPEFSTETVEIKGNKFLSITRTK